MTYIRKETKKNYFYHIFFQLFSASLFTVIHLHIFFFLIQYSVLLIQRKTKFVALLFFCRTVCWKAGVNEQCEQARYNGKYVDFCQKRWKMYSEVLFVFGVLLLCKWNEYVWYVCNNGSKKGMNICFCYFMKSGNELVCNASTIYLTKKN